MLRLPTVFIYDLKIYYRWLLHTHTHTHTVVDDVFPVAYILREGGRCNFSSYLSVRSRADPIGDNVLESRGGGGGVVCTARRRVTGNFTKFTATAAAAAQTAAPSRSCAMLTHTHTHTHMYTQIHTHTHYTNILRSLVTMTFGRTGGTILRRRRRQRGKRFSTFCCGI